MKNIMVFIIVLLLIISLFSFKLFKTENKVKENFPTSALQIACTDIDGDFFTTSDLILQNLKVDLNTDINNNLKVTNLISSSGVNFSQNVESINNNVEIEQTIEGTQTLTKKGTIVQDVIKQNVNDKNINGDLKCTNLNILPKGSIVMWDQLIAPSGWALCNGNNNTPNLRDRFIVGAGLNYSLNTTGGEKEVTLTLEEIPSHSHSYHTHNGSYSYRAAFEQNSHLALFEAGDDEDIKYTGGKSDGSTAPHNNIPSYYVLTFIIKL